LIVTHLLNARLFLAPTPYLSLNLFCPARPRSSVQALLASSLSARVGVAALAAAGSVKATATAASTIAISMTRLRLCNMLHPSCYQSIHDGGHARRPTLGEAWTEMSIRSAAPFRWPV
jgi:hypothetical protein